MKLLTHNMLTSTIIKGVKKGYPLGIAATKVAVTNVDYNPEFISKMIPKLEWSAFHGAAESLGHAENLPKELVPDYESNEEFLKNVHHALMEVEVQEGDLVCPETGRKFPISKGIPNMLLNEEEV